MHLWHQVGYYKQHASWRMNKTWHGMESVGPAHVRGSGTCAEQGRCATAPQPQIRTFTHGACLPADTVRSRLAGLTHPYSTLVGVRCCTAESQGKQRRTAGCSEHSPVSTPACHPAGCNCVGINAAVLCCGPSESVSDRPSQRCRLVKNRPCR